MNTSRFDPAASIAAHAGTIRAADVLPDGVKAPFRHAWGYLAGKGQMEIHSHPAEEVYFFHRGQGVVMVGDEERAMGPGEWVEIPPGVRHTVRNDSDGELLWFALWWPPVA